jgi:ADP-ribose pyrophosphatase YjhB (NUDIX family)
MSAKKISTAQAKQDKLFYFVANVIIYREIDGRCLILKRSKTEKVHPEKYAQPGGKLEWQDLDINHPTRMNGEVFDFENALEDLLKRETREESNLEIEDQIQYINGVAFVRPDGIPVMLVKMAAKYKSGEVKLEKGAFTDYQWVNVEEVKNYNCIEGIAKEIKKVIELYS